MGSNQKAPSRGVSRPTLIAKIERLETELKNVNEALQLKTTEAEDHYKKGKQWMEAGEEARRNERKTLEQLSDLKKALHSAEIRIADLNGYIRRSRQQELESQELVEVRLHDQIVKVPVAAVIFPERGTQPLPHYEGRPDVGDRDGDGRQHWVNFGCKR